MTKHRLPVKKTLTLIRQGLYDQQVADALGFNILTVWRFRTMRGIKSNVLKHYIVGTRAEKLKALLKKGMSDPDAAKRMGCSPVTVQHFRKKHGIPAYNPVRRCRQCHKLIYPKPGHKPPPKRFYCCRNCYEHWSLAH